jgi:putative heme iron utilization protein
MSKVTAIALANDYSSLLALLETSEDLTPEMIADTLEGLEGELADKLDAVMVVAQITASQKPAMTKLNGWRA